MALLVVSGCAAWRIDEAAALARRSVPLQQKPAGAALRLLVVGDSTGVGTGASLPKHSVAGLIAQAFPNLWIENRSQNGAKFADVAAQLNGDERYDAVLVLAGGNDVIRLRGVDDMRADLERVVQRAKQRAAQVVLMPAGNVGNAPFFFAPVSWLMTSRSRAMHRLVHEASEQHGIAYVNLFDKLAGSPSLPKASLYARDGLHPSDAGYRIWFTELMTQAELANRWAAARRGEAGRPWSPS